MNKNPVRLCAGPAPEPADQIAAQERYLASLNITLQRALYRHGAVSYIEVLSARGVLIMNSLSKIALFALWRSVRRPAADPHAGMAMHEQPAARAGAKHQRQRRHQSY